MIKKTIKITSVTLILLKLFFVVYLLMNYYKVKDYSSNLTNVELKGHVFDSKTKEKLPNSRIIYSYSYFIGPDIFMC